MSLSDWFTAHGETLQYAAYFLTLGAMAAAEVWFPSRRVAAGRAPRWRANFSLTLLNVIVLGALPLSFVTAASWAHARSFGLLNALSLPLWVELCAGLLARGFVSWITHLLMHKVPLFWRVHRVHHSDHELDVSTTVRFHPLEFPIGLAIGLPFVLTLGLSPWVLLAYECLDAAVTVFSHANVSLPRPLESRLRFVVVTPDLHRVHHSVDPAEADSNFSAVFPIWDLVFGTLRTPAETSPDAPLGLSEVRDERGLSLRWLLGAPFRKTLERQPDVQHAAPLADRG